MSVIPLEPGAPLSDHLDPYLAVDRPSHADRPWLLANMVAGLDGSIAVDGRVGPLSGAVDRKLFLDLRTVADVVLVGAETVRREGYGPVRLSGERRARREQDGRTPVPRLAVVSRSLDFGRDARWLRADGARPIVVTCASAPDDRRRALADRADVVEAGSDRVDPVAALAALRRSGVEVVLCEGGSALLGELLASHLVDELCLTLTPIVGGDPLSVAAVPATAELSRATLAHVLESDGDLFLRYVFR